MPYEFEYGVNDAPSGNKYGQRESSDGNVVKGEYRVLLPDGRLQIVTYTADSVNGYQAQVRYEGEAVFPAPTHHQPSYSTKKEEVPAVSTPIHQSSYSTTEEHLSREHLDQEHHHSPPQGLQPQEGFIPSQTFPNPQEIYTTSHHEDQIQNIDYNGPQTEYSQPQQIEFEQGYNTRYKRLENVDSPLQEPQNLLNLHLPVIEFSTLPKAAEGTNKPRKPTSVFIIRKAILSAHSESEEIPQETNALPRTFTPPHRQVSYEESYAR